MTPRFLKFIPFIFKWEGGYDNDPDDPGGETHYGIDQRSHPDVNIKHLTQEDATRIYWEDYWVKNRCESQPFPLGEVFFNACVNCGAGRARKILASGDQSASAFLDNQDAFYQRLVMARPTLHKYLKGWLNRTEDLRKVLGVEE